MPGFLHRLLLPSLLINGQIQLSRSLRFATIGDWGDPKAVVAKAMQNYIANSGGVGAIFSTGDNFYENGVDSVDDKQWKEVFENVFAEPSVQVPWYPVLGNHDYYVNPEAQIEYTTERNPSGRWNMPSNYYSEQFSLCDEPLTSNDCGVMEVLFIDTILLDPYEDKEVQRTLKPGYHQETRAQRQLDWIEQTLQSSTADWVFVVGHYPMYSVGANANDDRLRNLLEDLFNQYQVDAYFCGHDHLLEHLSAGSVHYYVSGSGTKLESKFHQDESYDKNEFIWAELQYGFTVHDITKDSMNVTFVNHKEHVIYTYTQQQKRNAAALADASYAATKSEKVSWRTASTPIFLAICSAISALGVLLLISSRRTKPSKALAKMKSLYLKTSAEKKSLLRSSNSLDYTHTRRSSAARDNKSQKGSITI
mmetsp:Transcript_3221/g.4537  ORF Transcript_3221/g.4537 Transcript_3221/m.4537 type:complete len:421 (+) Transcript_3221:138-1400(+)